MTRSQSDSKYFPAWSRAVKANWRSDRGTVLLLEKPANPQLAGQIDRIARAAVLKLHRAVTVDDLRHASHIVFLAAKKSSKDVTNKELDKLLANYKLLADPDDLSAVVAVQHPDQDARRRQIHALERCGKPEALLQSWCAHFNGGRRDWRDLPIPAFRRFVGYVWQRVKGEAAQRAKVKKDALLQPPPDFDPYAGRHSSTSFGTRRGD